MLLALGSNAVHHSACNHGTQPAAAGVSRLHRTVVLLAPALTLPPAPGSYQCPTPGHHAGEWGHTSHLVGGSTTATATRRLTTSKSH